MLHFAVIGHHSRQSRAEELADQLGAKLFLDHLTLGSSWNHLRALNWGSTLTGHLIVLEDDAEPVPDFTTRAEAFLTGHPDELVSFYLGTDNRRVQVTVDALLDEADTHGLDWITHSSMLHAVAYAIPCEQIRRLRFRPRFVADEMIGQAWTRPIIYTVPSYVDHADAPSIENPSRGVARKAKRMPDR